MLRYDAMMKRKIDNDDSILLAAQQYIQKYSTALHFFTLFGMFLELESELEFGIDQELFFMFVVM